MAAIPNHPIGRLNPAPPVRPAVARGDQQAPLVGLPAPTPRESVELGPAPPPEPIALEAAPAPVAPNRTEPVPTTLSFEDGAIGSHLLSASSQPAKADLVGDSGSDLSRNTVGWAGEPSESAPFDQSHRRLVARGMALMDQIAPGFRQRLDQLVSEHPDSALKLRGDQLLDEQSRIYADNGRVLNVPAEHLSPADAAKQKQLNERLGQIEKEWTRVDDQEHELKRQNREPAKDLATAFLGRLRDNASVRNAGASVTFTHEALAKLEERGIKPEQVRAWVNEFHHQTGLPMPDKLEFRYEAKRPYYRLQGDYINLGDPMDKRLTAPDAKPLTPEARQRLQEQDLKRLVLHEVAHRAEYRNPTVGIANKSWVRARAESAGNSTTDPTPLEKLVPKGDYEKGEVALEDHFINPYAGKVYPDSATEVLSLGLEHFSSPDRMLQLYRRDPEHFFLTLGSIETLKKDGW